MSRYVDEDKRFIKQFMNIKVARICEDLKINKSNIYSGRASDRNYSEIRDEIDRRLDKLYE